MAVLNRYIILPAKRVFWNSLSSYQTYDSRTRCSADLGINECRAKYRLRKWLFIAIVFMLIVFCSKTVFINPSEPKSAVNENVLSNTTNLTNTIHYRYTLDDGTEVTMQHEIINDFPTSYPWFMSMKPYFKNLGEEEDPKYPEVTPTCELVINTLGPITVKKTPLKMELVEKEHAHVKPGGFNSPAHCRSLYRMAIFVPYQDNEKNLSIFLYYIHRLLKIHLSHYRVFVIEQFGTKEFNRGMLLNVAFLESQRFGSWNCLIFHDVDTIPEDDRIFYTCNKSPFHFASAVEKYGYKLRYHEEFGGVTALTPAQFEAVNGYSNFYWNWGGEDDDMSARLKFTHLNISRIQPYHDSFVRFASLPRQNIKSGIANRLFLILCRQRYQMEGLRTTNYELIAVKKKKLYTHILVDVNPQKLKLDEKNLIRQMINISGKKDLVGWRNTFLMHKATKETTSDD